MATRWVLTPDASGRINTDPLMNDLAEDVANVMRELAPVDTGDMASTIRILNNNADDARIVSVGGIKGKVTGNLVDYVVYVERGTSKMAAQPFMRPALYRYRSP